MSGSFDRHARIVIIGGGAIGCAVAYALTRRGERDVLLLEKSQITNGCTWHAAGLVGQLRGRKNLTRLMQNSVAVFDRLEAESGQAIDWRKVGSLRLASSSDRWSEIRRSMTLGQELRLRMSLSLGKRGRRSVPLYRSGGRGRGGVHSLRRLRRSLCAHPSLRLRGAQGRREAARGHDRHRHPQRRPDRSLGVTTDHGTVGCDILVNCAGLWAKRIADMAGVALAAGVVEHQYFITEKKLDLPKTLPTLRDPDKNFYLKPDVGAFAIGGWEKGTKGCWRSRPPFEFGRELFPENMERLELFALPCAERLPVLNEIGIQTIINGPIPVSADGEPILGLAPELDNFFVACRVHRRHCRLWRRRRGDGQLDPRRRSRHGPLGLRRAPVRRPAQLPAAISRKGPSRPTAIITPSIGLARKTKPAAVCGARLCMSISRLPAPSSARASASSARFAFPILVLAGKEIPSFEDRPSWFDQVGKEHRHIREGVALIDQTSFCQIHHRRAWRHVLPRGRSARTASPASRGAASTR